MYKSGKEEGVDLEEAVAHKDEEATEDDPSQKKEDGVKLSSLVSGFE